MTDVRYARSGDPVMRHMHASTWNQFLAAADAKMFDTRQDKPDAMVWARENPVLTTMFKNTGTDALSRSIRELASPPILPSESSGDFGQRIAMQGGDPTAASHGRFTVLMQAVLQDDSSVRSAVNGIVACKLFVPTNGTWIGRADVDVSDGSRLLAHPGGSAQILWKDAGTNTEVDALVRLGNPENVSLLCKPTADLVAGTSGPCEVYSDSATPTGFVITAVLDWMSGGQTISTGKECVATWFPLENVLRITHAECEDTGSAAGQLFDSGPHVQGVASGVLEPIAAYDATKNLATSDVTLDALAGTIQLPDITPAAGRLARVNFSASLQAPSNNSAIELVFNVNGTSMPPAAFAVTVQNASNSQTIAVNFYHLLAQQSAPVVLLEVEVDKTGDVTWGTRTFGITLL